ncbi:Gryzun, putative trafficking through golgi-domain-containing protein [Powellomyces hirtus]|nr:Gryzun, putative trafficking through golgi-domain-containing protein [Powellomyces hirtus]
MESYPLEYVLHHVPLMAVSGLLDTEVLGNNDGMLQEDAGGSLRKSLLSVLMSKNNASIWDAAAKKEAPFFHVTVLDKTHVFPPRRSPRATPAQHSNLSPLNPISPLHPDGIMIPAWIQRHKETRPSVVVGFYDLWERSEAVDSSDPLGAQQTLSLERERDLILCSEVMEKKRNTGERGIKFAIVITLQASRGDDTHVEERLAFIRRTCSLDNKSLFVLLAQNADLQLFVTIMQKSLYEQSANYYRDHDKRIRKKKARLPPISAMRATTSPTSANIPSSTGTPAKPLPPAGWHLRYEFKLGVFAEFRQDVEAAIKHYETTYHLLIELMHAAIGPNSWPPMAQDFLQPFTTRWTEARTLADCVNLKICKLHLYTDRPVPALQQLDKHISACKMFPEFVGRPSTEEQQGVSSGISKLGNLAGGGSFDYWAWVSIQYRVFGELIELATGKIGLRLPFPPPGAISAVNTGTGQAQSFLNTISNTSMNALTGGDMPAAQFTPSSATSPSLVVQHAGYYYFIAASCAEERWKKFRDAEKAITSAPPPPPSAATGARAGHSRIYADIPSSPFSPLMSSTSTHPQSYESSLGSERDVDHATFVIELLTKSYEQFKKHRAGRMTLFLASEIARVYEQSGKYEMALKFFERIGKTYRKEHWPSVLRDVLRSSAQCARTLGRWETVAECLVELLNERMSKPGPDGESERKAVLQELLSVIRGEGSNPSNGIKVIVDMDQLEGFLLCTVQFRKHSTYVGVAAPFQICLKAASSKSPPVAIRISRVQIAFSDSRFDHVFSDSNADGIAKAREIQWVDCTDCSLTTVEEGREVYSKAIDLDFQPGMSKVLEGTVTPGEGMDLKISAVSIVVTAGEGSLILVYKIGERSEDTSTRRKWYSGDGDEAGINRWTMLDGSGEQSVLRVIRKQPNLTIQLNHAPPGLINEEYEVDVEVVNEEFEDVEAFLDVEFRSSGADGLDATSYIKQQTNHLESPTLPGNDHNAINLIHLGVIPAHARVSRRFWLKCTENAGERVMYNIVNYRSISRTATSPTSPEKATPATHPEFFFRKNEPVRIPFVAPFTPEFKETVEFGAPFDAGEAGLFSARSQDGKLDMMHLRNIGLKIVCPGPWELEVTEVMFTQAIDETVGVRSVQVAPVTNTSTSNPNGEVWKAGYVHSRVFRVVAAIDPMAEVSPIPLGEVGVRWRRKVPNRNSTSWVETRICLPKLKISHDSVCACIDIPPLIFYTEPFTVTYTLYNLSLATHHLSMNMEVTDGFVFSGYKQTQARLLPLSSMVVTYNCVPIVCGKTTLPKLKISIMGEGADLTKHGPGQEVTDLRVRGGVDSGVGTAGELIAFVRPRNS